MAETPEARFKRVGSRRVRAVLKDLELLANCSNRHNYLFTEEEVRQMKLAIQAAVDETMGKFAIKRSKSFNFQGGSIE